MCIMNEYTRKAFMPSTATAPKTATRKPRARKAKATPKASVPVAKVTVTTYRGGKVTQKTSEFTRPSTARLISPERYLKDIATRWQIHQYEMQELGKDIRKGFELVAPYHQQLVKQVKSIQLLN